MPPRERQALHEQGAGVELPDDGTNIVVLSHNWESTKLRNLKVKKLAQNLFWWPDILNRK